MLDLDPRNDCYDPAAELAALLPPRPIGVPVQLVLEDLGCNIVQLRKCIAELNRRGVYVGLWHGKHGRVISIDPDDWPTAQKLAETYVSRLERFAA